MYNPHLQFSTEDLERCKPTKQIVMISEIFKLPIPFDKLPTRVCNILKRHECETIGEMYYFMFEEWDSLGRITLFEITNILIHSFMPCKLAIEVAVAFFISKDEWVEDSVVSKQSVGNEINRMETDGEMLKENGNECQKKSIEG